MKEQLSRLPSGTYRPASEEAKGDSLLPFSSPSAVAKITKKAFVYQRDYEVHHLVNDAAIWDENWFTNYE